MVHCVVLVIDTKDKQYRLSKSQYPAPSSAVLVKDTDWGIGVNNHRVLKCPRTSKCHTNGAGYTENLLPFKLNDLLLSGMFTWYLAY